MRDIWHMPRAAVFLAVVDAGSITKAAKNLGLAKSVVSVHLKQLEDVCGARLLERTTRKLRLTEAGERFMPAARRLVDAWHEGLDLLSASMEQPTGTLCVSASSLFERVILAPAIASFVAQYPHVEVDVRLEDNLIDLMAEKVDLALRSGPLADSNLIARKLGHDEEIIVAAPALADKLGDVSHPDQLLSVAWIVHRRLPRSVALYGPGNERVMFSIPARVQIDTAAAMVALAEGGIGLALVPRIMLESRLTDGVLVRLLPKWSGASMDIHAVYPSKDYLPPKVSRFIDVLQREIQDFFQGVE
jgi:DNA-binding transcriptional LysR family regulator